MELKIKDIVDLLQVTEKTVYRWLKDRKIPAYRINHQYRFNRAEINEWILKNKISVSDKILDLNLTTQPVSIVRLLGKGGIHRDIAGSTVKEVISSAVRAIPAPENPGREAIYTSLIEREEMMPTAIGRGIAIPHPRNPIIADVENESISLCFLKNPVDYGAVDGTMVHSLFILLSANAKRHLEILSKISLLCQQADFGILLESRSEEKTILKYIENKEDEWRKR